MKKTFKKEVKLKAVKSVEGHGGCEHCYFGRKREDDNWDCDTDEVDRWGVTDCVFDYDDPMIYVEVKKS